MALGDYVRKATPKKASPLARPAGSTAPSAMTALSATNRGAAALRAPMKKAAPSAPSGGGGGGGGLPRTYTQTHDMSYGGGGGGSIAPMSAVAAPDYTTDPEYLAAKGAYDNVFDQLMATITRENTAYDLDFGKAQDNMGWRGADKGGWDFGNVDTAAGRGMKNLTDDYAARGMLRGSGFGEAQNSFQTSLQKQLDMLIGQKKEFGDQQLEKQTQGQTSRDQAIQMAAAQALSRLSQMYTAV